MRDILKKDYIMRMGGLSGQMETVMMVSGGKEEWMELGFLKIMKDLL